MSPKLQSVLDQVSRRGISYGVRPDHSAFAVIAGSLIDLTTATDVDGLVAQWKASRVEPRSPSFDTAKTNYVRT